MGNQNPSVRIVIADDHAMLRDGLRCLLETEPDFEVVGEAADGTEAITRTRELAPDILLLNLTMPQASGLDVIRELSSEGAELLTRVILVTEEVEYTKIVQALQMGARGVVTMGTPTALLMKAVRAVIAGQYWIGREDVGNIINFMRTNTSMEKQPPNFGLTKREMEILTTIVQGLSNKEIAGKFSLSEYTVKHHLAKIFDKVGVVSRLELALFAITNRLVEPGAVRAG